MNMKLHDTAFFLFIFFLFVNNTFPQNPGWINYTNGDDKNAIEFEGNIVWIGRDESGPAVFKGGDWLFYNTTNSALRSYQGHRLTIDNKDTFALSYAW